MGHVEEEQLKVEIQHIFDSGANEIRILEMVKSFINSRKTYTEKQVDNAYDKGFKDASIKQLRIGSVSKSFTVDEIISELEDSVFLEDAIMFFKESK